MSRLYRCTRSRHGRASVPLLVLLAGVCFTIGIASAVAIGSRSRPAAAAPAPAQTAVSGGGGGGATAVPTQYAWLDRSQAELLGLSQGRETNAPVPTATASAPAGGTDVAQTQPLAPTQPVIAPKVVGQSLEAAKDLLAGAQLQLVLKDTRHSDIPSGRIATQSPDPGQAVSDGIVYVSKSLGPAPEPKPRPVAKRKRTTSRRSSGGGCSGDCSRCHPGR